VLEVVDRDKSLHIRPLDDEISECLRSDHVVGPKIDGIGAELDCPFDDAVVGFLIAENVAERVLRDYRYVVGIEVVVELPRCDKDSVQ